MINATLSDELQCYDYKQPKWKHWCYLEMLPGTWCFKLCSKKSFLIKQSFEVMATITAEHRPLRIGDELPWTRELYSRSSGFCICSFSQNLVWSSCFSYLAKVSPLLTSQERFTCSWEVQYQCNLSDCTGMHFQAAGSLRTFDGFWRLFLASWWACLASHTSERWQLCWTLFNVNVTFPKLKTPPKCLPYFSCFLYKTFYWPWVSRHIFK